MSKIKTGGPAFPVPDLHNNGMTLRDYFAAKAMQGFAADPGMGSLGSAAIAVLAYSWADAMIKAREGGAA